MRLPLKANNVQKAMAANRFAEEIVPVRIKDKKGMKSSLIQMNIPVQIQL